jgi:hypothetical protein
MRASALAIVASLVCSLVCVESASAQPASLGCALQQPATVPPTLRCASGLTITIEEGAQYTLLDRDRNGVVDAVELQGKALLLDAPKQRTRQRFEVITPQAIAAVRGTRWAVDVQGASTAVFVVGGRVAVRRRAGAARVVLGPGEGVDVDAGTGALTVKRWPQPRVDALLARLGQR